MTDAPKRIYLDQDAEEGDGIFLLCFENPKYCGEPAVEYHRADLSADLVRAGYLAGVKDVQEIASDAEVFDISDAAEYLAADPEAVAAIITSVLGETK